MIHRRFSSEPRLFVGKIPQDHQVSSMQPSLVWQRVGNYSDILYEKSSGIARVTINRPKNRNAFTPDTVAELIHAFNDAREDTSIGVVLLRGRIHNPMASMLFVPVEIKKSVAIKKEVTSVKMVSLVLMS